MKITELLLFKKLYFVSSFKMTCLTKTLLYYFKDQLRKMTKEMLTKFGTQRYIANVGHGIYPDTNPDHLATFIDAIHHYSEEMNGTA